MRRRDLGMLVLTIAAFFAGSERAAQAAPEPETPERSKCVLRGVSLIAKGTEIHDAPVGGRVIAVLNGVLVPATMSELPISPRLAPEVRARFSTSDGTPSFRIDGYIQAAAVPIYTTRDLPFAGQQLAIAADQDVRLVGALPGGLRVERRILGTDQVLAVDAPCDAFALEPSGKAPILDSTGARGWRTKVPAVELRDAPAGGVIFTLRLEGNNQQNFWSREARAGFAHVLSRNDIVIDAWVSLRDLEPLSANDFIEPYVPRKRIGAEVGIGGEPPRERVAGKDIPIRLVPDSRDPVIGVIESGAEFYFFSSEKGFASVLPKTLVAKPPAGGVVFYVPAGDVTP